MSENGSTVWDITVPQVWDVWDVVTPEVWDVTKPEVWDVWDRVDGRSEMALAAA